MTSSPFWVSAFLDLPADRHEQGTAFWERVTGYRRRSAHLDWCATDRDAEAQR